MISTARNKKIADLRTNEDINTKNYCLATRRFSQQLTTQVCLENKISLENYKETLSEKIPDDLPLLSISESDLENDGSDYDYDSEFDEDPAEEENHFDRNKPVNNDNDPSND